MGNQNPQAEEGQTTHRPKRDRQHTGRRGTDNTQAEWKRTTGKTIIYKTLEN